MAWAEGHLETMYGTLVSRWEIENDQFIMKVSIPANTTAVIHIPIVNDSWSVIEESAKVLVKDGISVTSTQGLNFIEANDSETIFEAGAGNYTFTVK